MKTVGKQEIKQKKIVCINSNDKQILSLEATSKGLSLKAYLEQEISRLAEAVEDKWLAMLAQQPEANVRLAKEEKDEFERRLEML